MGLPLGWLAAPGAALTIGALGLGATGFAYALYTWGLTRVAASTAVTLANSGQQAGVDFALVPVNVRLLGRVIYQGEGVPGLAGTFLAANSIVWFLLKTCFFLFLYLWFRATFPRYRYDQIMRLGWKVFIPVTIVWIAVEGVMAWYEVGPWAGVAYYLGDLNTDFRFGRPNLAGGLGVRLPRRGGLPGRLREVVE